MNASILQLIRYFVTVYNYELSHFNEKNNFAILVKKHTAIDCIVLTNKIIYESTKKNLLNLLEEFYQTIDYQAKKPVLISSNAMQNLLDDFISMSILKDHNTIVGFPLIDYFDDIFSTIQSVPQKNIEAKIIKKQIQNKERFEFTRKNKIINFYQRIGITSVLFFLCIVMFILVHSIGPNSTYNAIRLGANFSLFVIEYHDLWRLITAAFIHIDLFHLALNLYCLYIYGPVLEHILGKLKYSLLVILGAFIGNAFSVIMNIDVLAIGFSTVGYAMMVVYILLAYKRGLLRNYSSVLFLILINIYISLQPGIDLYGHIGGAVGGLFIYLIYQYPKNIHYKLLLVLLILFIFAKLIFFYQFDFITFGGVGFVKELILLA